MTIETSCYRIGHGWSVPVFPGLGGDQTLVLVFGGAKAIEGGVPRATSQVIGFYSYGEVSPFSDGRCDLYHQAMTLTTLSES